MNKLNTFDDYLLDLIEEGYKNDELMLMLSPRLENLINSIQHPIAQLLLSVTNNRNEFTNKITLLDVSNDPNKLDNISFFTSVKLMDKLNPFSDLDLKQDEFDDYTFNKINDRLIYGFRNFINDKSHSVTTLGRIINKLFPDRFKASGEPGYDIESFVNLYKAKRDAVDFRLVKGIEIITYYNRNKYVYGGGSLNHSCMSHSECNKFIEFYAKNSHKVSLLILMDTEDPEKIRGRALIWELDKPKGRFFMDRIYTKNGYDVEIFKDYAEKNGWLYKVEQSYIDDGEIDEFYDTRKKEVISDLTLIVNDIERNDYYPFVDTMCYFNNGVLSNNMNVLITKKHPTIYKLRDTGGRMNKLYFSNYYYQYIDITNEYNFCPDINDYRNDNDCYHSDFYNYFIDNDYANDNMFNCDEYCDDETDSYRKKGDCVKTTNGYADKEYAKEYMTYSKFSKVWIKDAVYSIKYKSPLNADDTVLVYLDAEQTNADYRLTNDGTYFIFEFDNDRYDNKVKVEDLNKKYKLKG